MKKLFTMFAALAMAATFSANAETVEIAACNNVQHPTQVTDKTVTVVVDLTVKDQVLNVPYIATVGGSWVNPTIANWAADGSEVEGLPISAEVVTVGEKTTATIEITPDMWGVPSNGAYTIMIGFPDLYYVGEGDKKIEPGYPMLNEDGSIEIGTTSPAEIYITIPDDSPAQYVGVYPSEEEMDGMTVQDLYESGMMGFMFTNVVNFDNAEAYIYFYVGEDIYEVMASSASMMSDWDRSGNYLLAVLFEEFPEDITLEEVTAISVSIEGVTDANGTAISVPEAYFENPVQKRAPKKTKGAQSNLKLGVDANLGSTVYSINGVLVNKSASVSDIQNLPAGMYVIDGKKVAVK